MPRASVLGGATRVEPGPDDQKALAELLAHDSSGDMILRMTDGAEVNLPAPLRRILLAVAGNLATGHAVLAIPAEVNLTPAEVAELLGLSRPFVARLLEHGEIPSEFLPGSRHRRVKLSDVLAFQERRERRAEGRRRIADIVSSAELPY